MVYKIEGKTRVLEEKTLSEQTKRARTNLTDPQLASMPGLVPKPRCWQASALRQQSVISAPHILIGCVMWYRIFTVNLAITLGSEGLGNGLQHPFCCFMTQKLN